MEAGMKKVAIITLNGYFNYGNRLQNYALQELLKGQGFEVETIINETKFNKQPKSKVQVIKEKSVKDLFTVLNTKVQNYLYKNKLNQKRAEIFKDFTSSNILETEYSISEKHIPGDLSEKYNFFVTGSDQVWNPNYRKGSFIEFLTFVPCEKRIAYAPSFGVSEIPKEYIKNYQLWLSEMAHLSVREEAGAKIIKDLTGRDATIVLDPTMMLTKGKWLSISRVPTDKPKKRYLLTYFLGNIDRKSTRLNSSHVSNSNA